MICPHCHSENREEAKFCNECGMPLVGSSDASADKILDSKSVSLSNKSTSMDTADTSHNETLPPSAPENSGPLDPSRIPAIEVSGIPVESFDSSFRLDETKESDEDEFDFSDIDERDMNYEKNPVNSSKSITRTTTFSAPPNAKVEGISPVHESPLLSNAQLDHNPPDGAGRIAKKDDTAPPKEKPEGSSFGKVGATTDDALSKLGSTSNKSADKTVDLSGIDECLVDSTYVAPQVNWHAGDTMEMPRIEGTPAPKQKEYRAPDQHKKKHGKRKAIIITVIFILIAAGVAAAITYRLELWGGKVVPSVVGLTQTDATYVLKNKDFKVVMKKEKSDAAEGIVLSMNPGAGARQQEGSEVVIGISEARTVPDVVGSQKEEANTTLKNNGFENISFDEQKSDKPEGTVLAIQPGVGSKAKANDPLTVSVAVPYVVPDITGMNYDQVKAAIEAAGLVVNTSYVYNDKVDEGTVLSLDPASGTKVSGGSTVTVNVAKSRGNELIAATQSYLGSVGTISIDGTSYQIKSVDGVTYKGNNTTAFSITAAAVTTLDGEKVHGSYKQKNGTIVWDNANNIVSIS